MVERHHYYNIFSPEGKLLQIEYALEAVNNSNPVVIARNKDILVCASKKLYCSKLMDEEPKSTFKVSPRVHALLTGLEGDVDQVFLYSSSLASNNELRLGLELTPDILCRAFSDKVQKLIQSTGQRAFAFGAAFFGFDFGSPSIYATDTSATFYPYFGYAYGQKSGRMRKFLEVNLSTDMADEELVDVVVQSLLESVGEESTPDKIELCILEREKDLRYLAESEKEAILQRISDK